MEKIIKVGRMSVFIFIIRILFDILAMSIGIGFIWLIRDLIAFYNTRLTITSNRISEHTGLINTVDVDSPLNKINNVKVEQSLLGKIFNYGTIYVYTSSNVHKFKNISKANEFKEILNNQIFLYSNKVRIA